jgi:hypothetical protein
METEMPGSLLVLVNSWAQLESFSAKATICWLAILAVINKGNNRSTQAEC